tara:strand:+ start:553 stop:720 length:168 start_codon:yes stop_codon:yes gene_type:complete
MEITAVALLPDFPGDKPYYPQRWRISYITIDGDKRDFEVSAHSIEDAVYAAKGRH